VQLLVWPTLFGATVIVLGQLWRIDRLGLLYEQQQHEQQQRASDGDRIASLEIR
jgi:hypothetical protein